MKPINIILCVIICVVSGCANYTTVRQHKDFAKLFPKYKSVAIFTSDFLVEKTTKNGKQVIHPNPNFISNVTNTAQSELAKKGYVVTGVVSDSDTDSAEIDEFNYSYKKSVKKLYGNKENGLKDKAFNINDSLGMVATKVAKKSNADLLFVLGYSGSEMSQDQVTKNLAMDMAVDIAVASLTGSQSSNAGATHIKDGLAVISLIDRKNGNIMWTNTGADFETYGTSIARIITKNNVLETAFSKAIKELPDK